MSELAYTKMGQRFAPPPLVAYWAVHRLSDNRGVKVVYDDNGVPLTIPVTAGKDELRDSVNDEPGRYKLIPLDESFAEIRDVPRAFVTLPARRAAETDERSVVLVPTLAAEPANTNVSAVGTVSVATPGAWAGLPMPTSMSGAEYLLAEAWRGHVQMQVEMVRNLTSSLAAQASATTAGVTQMMTAASELLRAADGAAMPRRPPVIEPVAALPPASVLPSLAYPPMAEPRNAARHALDPDGFRYDADTDAFDEEDPGEGREADAPSATANAEEDQMAKFAKVVGNVMGAVNPALTQIATMVRGHAPVANAALRNAAPEMAAEDEAPEPEEEPFVVTPAMRAYMRLVERELGASDTRLFHAVYERLDSAQRQALITRCCELPVEQAAEAAAMMIAPLKLRIARHARRRSEAATAQPQVARHQAPARSATVPDESEHLAPDLELDHQAEHSRDSQSGTDIASESAVDELEASGVDSPDDAPVEGNDIAPDPDPEDIDAADSTDHEVYVTGGDAPARPLEPRAPAPRQKLAPDAEAHLRQIATHLTWIERATVLGMMENASDAERASWTQKLGKLAPPEAATLVRAELARRAGG